MKRPNAPQMEIVVDGVDGTFTDIRSAEQSADYRHGVRAAAAILLGLVVLCALASLSGCLTATKIHRWESALLGWARKGGPECRESAKVASKYLTNANRTLQGATSALDLATDQEAKKLMTKAAQKCGEVVP